MERIKGFKINACKLLQDFSVGLLQKLPIIKLLWLSSSGILRSSHYLLLPNTRTSFSRQDMAVVQK